MYDNDQRIDEFRAELAALRTKSTSSVTGDARLLWLGGLLMAAGVVAIVFGYWGAANTTQTYEAISYLISGGVLGIALVIIGVALFLRYSFAGFLKFWLVRWVYEQQAQTDRLLDALERSEGSARDEVDVGEDPPAAPREETDPVDQGLRTPAASPEPPPPAPVAEPAAAPAADLSGILRPPQPPAPSS